MATVNFSATSVLVPRRPRKARSHRRAIFATTSALLIATLVPIQVGNSPIATAAQAAEVSIGDATNWETQSGNQTMTFAVTLTEPSALPVSVTATIAADTACAEVSAMCTAPDFTKPFNTSVITIAPGARQRYVNVVVKGDTAPEADEFFTLELSSPTGSYAVGKRFGLGTIRNDDYVPAVSGAILGISDASIHEGDVGKRKVKIWAQLLSPVTTTVTVTATASAVGQTASSSDFIPRTHLLTFLPGVRSRYFEVTIRPDGIEETDETIDVALSNPTGAYIGDGLGTVTVLDDDPPIEVAVTGAEETVIASGTWGLNWIPDGHITFLHEPSGFRMWITSLVSTYEFGGIDMPSAIPTNLDDGGNAIAAFGPSHIPGSFDDDYAGVGNVIRAPNGSLLMVYHGEDHLGVWDCAVANIGVAHSIDNGATWTRKGKVISTPQPSPTVCPMANRKFSGAGQPSAALGADGFVYVWFVQWLDPTLATGAMLAPDQIYVARSPLAGGLLPGTWSKWHNGQWLEPGLGGQATAVITPPSPFRKHMVAAMPSMSWHAPTNKWLALFQTMQGLSVTSSTDGINWRRSDELLVEPALLGPNIAVGTPVIAYTSLLSPTTGNDYTTNRSGYIYFARSIAGANGTFAAHHLSRKQVTIS